MSDRPEEPAVDGRTSRGDSDCLVSFLAGLFRVGTISGHVHCGIKLIDSPDGRKKWCVPSAECPDTVCNPASLHHTARRKNINGLAFNRPKSTTYLHFLRPARQASGLAASKFTAFALGGLGLEGGSCHGTVRLGFDGHGPLDIVRVVGELAMDKHSSVSTRAGMTREVRTIERGPTWRS